ncbi:MAG: DUF3108 domain-containing protein [Caldilineaceae bacterium]
MRVARPRGARGWRVLLVSLILLAACGQPEMQPLSLDAMPWRSGETSSYQITDSNGAAAGTARYTITAGDPQSNAGGWTIQREIAAQGVQEVVIAQVDKDDLRPSTSLLTRTSSQGKEIVKAIYTSDGVDLDLTSAMNVTTNQHIAAPSDARVEATVLQLVRALPLAANYATRLNSFSPATGGVDRVTVLAVKEESIAVPAGTFNTWQVELDMGNSKTKVWIGRDAPHPLVKYIDGRNGGTFELSAFKPGE